MSELFPLSTKTFFTGLEHMKGMGENEFMHGKQQVGFKHPKSSTRSTTAFARELLKISDCAGQEARVGAAELSQK
jgi:hypothetical protein